MPMEKLMFNLLSTMIHFTVSEARGHLPIPLYSRRPWYTKTLFLDLDETLVFARNQEQYDGQGAFQFWDPEGVPLVGQLREGVVETLQALEHGTPGGDRWELIVWTAGWNCFGQSIAEYLRHEKGIEISHVIGRERSGALDHQKDITRLISETRPLDSMIIVDNKPESCYPPENTIGIRSWYGYNQVPQETMKWFEAQDLDPLELQLMRPISGRDQGEAMRQLKFALDELNGESITSEELQFMLGLEHKSQEQEQLSQLMIFYQPQRVVCPRAVAMARGLEPLKFVDDDLSECETPEALDESLSDVPEHCGEGRSSFDCGIRQIFRKLGRRLSTHRDRPVECQPENQQ